MYIQMPLKIELRDEVAFETYVAPSERVAVALHHFQQGLQSQNGESFYLYGSAGSGKTHLLQAACRMMAEQGRQSVFLPLADRHLPLISDVLQGLEQVDLVCLDDIERVIGDEAWENALASLLSKSAIAGHHVVLAGQTSMVEWQFATQALNRAMVNVLPVQLAPLDNAEDIVKAMQRHAQKIGVALSKEVGNHLIKQFSTNMTELMEVFQLLIEQSLVEKHRLTLPFVKKVLKEIFA